MTDREKCLVFNGLRSFVLTMAELAGEDVQRADAQCNEVARRLGIDPGMLELTRQEGKAFCTFILGHTQPYHSRGN